MSLPKSSSCSNEKVLHIKIYCNGGIGSSRASIITEMGMRVCSNIDSSRAVTVALSLLVPVIVVEE